MGVSLDPVGVHLVTSNAEMTSPTTAKKAGVSACRVGERGERRHRPPRPVAGERNAVDAFQALEQRLNALFVAPHGAGAALRPSTPPCHSAITATAPRQ